MITIREPLKEKREIKKLFKDNSLCLKLVPYNENKVDIVFSGSDHNKVLTYTITADMTSYSLHNKVTLSFVDPTDCVFDIIFAKDGFYVTTYENAYSELITQSKSGSEGFISQVIFKSRTKRRDFVAPCNTYCRMIS